MYDIDILCVVCVVCADGSGFCLAVPPMTISSCRIRTAESSLEHVIGGPVWNIQNLVVQWFFLISKPRTDPWSAQPVFFFSWAFHHWP